MKHSFGRTLALSALVIAGSARGAAAQELPSAKQIVERYVEAIGKDAATRHNFRRVVAEMTLPTGAMTMDMKFARPNKMVVNAEMPGLGAVRSGFDGARGWTVNPMSGAQLMEGKELEQLLRQADFDASFNLAAQFPSMTTVERSTANGQPCHRVRMVSVSQDTVHACFDVATGLMSQMQTRQESQMGKLETTVNMLDYKDFGGVKMPTRTVTQVMGQEMTMTIKSVSTDPIAPAEFEPPAEIKALMQQQPAAPRNQD
ncbi:MAG TPA: hypothetical protein VK420_19505 [Longimicrobium sp.]|nr:hypothetical protein [Longimicrobium sp.]